MEATGVMGAMENTAFMDMVVAMDMDGEIVISIWINLNLFYLINNDGEL